MNTVTLPGTEGFPLWALLLSVLLTGGGGAALWNLIAARMSQTATREVTASTANMQDVSALNAAITGLAGENNRLGTRLRTCEEQIEELRAELLRRPTKDELKQSIEALHVYIDGLRGYIDKLRTQLIAAGIHPVPESPATFGVQTPLEPE